MNRSIRSLLLSAAISPIAMQGQTLVDSIPYPGITNLSFWGIDVTPDTIFLGADFPGNIYYSDHNGNLIGNISTGFDFNHGLIRRQHSYLIAEDFTDPGAGLYEVDLQGNLLDQWVFPPGISGNASGVGDITDAGDGAIWFTVYYPHADSPPYTYAYKWMPGSTTFLDTVPMQGKQPYGVALKGDTLLYVMDSNDDDLERIYAYDLVNEQDLFWFDLPDTQVDNDQRPQGLDWDGNFLYLVGNRSGGSAFAHQTIFIYHIDFSTGNPELHDPKQIQIYPNPASDVINVELPVNATVDHTIAVYDAQGRLVHEMLATDLRQRIDVFNWNAGSYLVNVSNRGEVIATQRVSIAH